MRFPERDRAAGPQSSLSPPPSSRPRRVPAIVFRERLVVTLVLLLATWCMWQYLCFCFYASVWIPLTGAGRTGRQHRTGGAAGEAFVPHERYTARLAAFWDSLHFARVAPSQWIWLGATTLLVCMALWSYIQCITTDPGDVPPVFRFDEVLEEHTSLAPTVARLDICQPCDAFKPRRTHHCSRCARCVLKYDHHCAWMCGTCIGFHNYKLFLLFITYTFLLGFFMCLTLSRSVYMRLLSNVHDATAEGSELHQWAQDTGKLVAATPDAILKNEVTASPALFGWRIVVTFVCIFLTQSFCSTLMWRHFFLVKRNITTVEQVIFGEDCVSAFDLGWRENLLQVFGGGSVCTSILALTCARRTNGRGGSTDRSPLVMPVHPHRGTYGTLAPSAEVRSGDNNGGAETPHGFPQGVALAELRAAEGCRPRGAALGWQWWVRAALPLRAYPARSPQHARLGAFIGTHFPRCVGGRSPSVLFDYDTADDAEGGGGSSSSSGEAEKGGATNPRAPLLGVVVSGGSGSGGGSSSGGGSGAVEDSHLSSISSLTQLSRSRNEPVPFSRASRDVINDSPFDVGDDD